MAVFELGLAIKARREQLNLSQEDLADGICAVATLSRIENGERLPTAEHGAQLLERLGHSMILSDAVDSKERLWIHESKIEIRQAVMDLDYATARVNYTALQGKIKNPTKSDQQFMVMYQAILNRGSIPLEQELALLEEAILLTCPKYKTEGIPKLLSYDEIIVLNNIAICYGRMGDHGKAVEILSVIREFYDRHVIYTEEALRTQPMILCNLSNHLGLMGRYDECIAVCDKGIKLAQKTGRCPSLMKTLYNRAWAMLRRQNPGDREMAEESLRHAVYMAIVMDRAKELPTIKNYYERNFGNITLK